MKSVADIALVAAAGLITIIGVYSFGVGYQLQTLGRDATDRSVIESINQMEFAKTAIDHSIIYSTDQGVYDTLNGKYDIQGCNPQRAADNIPFWRTDEKTCTPSNFETSISSNTQLVFNEYYAPLKAISSKIKIILPSYQLKFSTASFTVQADADKQLEFKTDTIDIKDVGDRKYDSGILANDYIDTAKEKFINQDPIKESVVSAYNTQTADCRQLSHTETFNGCTPVSGLLISKQNLLDQQCPNVLNKFSTTIVNNVNDLSNSLNAEKVNVNVQTIKDFVKTTVDTNDESTCHVSSSCPCAETRTNRIVEECGTPEIPKQCVSYEEECIRYETISVQTCSYNYKAGADALASISNKFSNKVPVYDSLEGKTTNKEIRLSLWGRTQLDFSNGAIKLTSLGLSLPDRRLLPEINLPSQPSAGNQEPTSGSYVWPLPSQYKTITSPLGSRTVIFNDKPLSDFHTGIDIAAPKGTTVTASASGTVEETCSYNFIEWGLFNTFRFGNWDQSLQQLIGFYNNFKCGWPGQYVLVKNSDGMETLYIHLDSLSVKQGDSVTSGTTKIGEVGTTGISTGYHLHFQVCQEGSPVYSNGKLISAAPCKLNQIVDPCNFVNC